MAEPKPGARRGGGSLNMTSMIDVVFLLLIFFIVSTEFRTIEGLLPNNLPGEGPPPDGILPELRIVLSEDPTAAGVGFSARLRVPSARVNLSGPEQLTELIRGLIAQHGELYRQHTPVLIQADPGVLYNDVVLVYDAVLAARMKNVSFAL